METETPSMAAPLSEEPPGSPAPGGLSAAARHLHRVTGVPFRLAVGGGIVHDSLEDRRGKRRALGGPEGRRAEVVVSAEAGEEEVLALLRVLSPLVGMAEEVRRHREERLGVELRLAHDLQLKLLPDPRSVADLADVAARCEPAESVGGDFFHLVRLGGGRLGLMLGDVSSHGISAALLMAQVLSAAGIVARDEGHPGEVVRRIRRELDRELASTEMHLSLFYGVMAAEGSDRYLRYANAGHPHAFLLGCGGTGAQRLEALDPPLGTEGPGPFREAAVKCGEGDVLLLFTDGLFEPARQGRVESESLLVEAARGAVDGEMEAVVEALFTASDRMEGGGDDDRTAMAVRL